MKSLSVRPTEALIDRQSLRENLIALQAAAQVPVWGVVKADAYGHGACEVARVLQDAGVAGLCVSLLEEAVQLREAGIATPILVMGGSYEGAYEALLEHRLIPVLSRGDQIRACAAAVRRSLVPSLPVHLKLDTGMARLGAPPEQWSSLVSQLSQTGEVQLEGLMTHLACAGESDASVAEQLRRFSLGFEQFRSLSGEGLTRHAANTAGTLAHRTARLEAVRVGIGLYGYAPGVSIACGLPALKSVMRVRTQVVALRTLERGDSVGYGGRFRATERSRIATVPMGYADGLSRALSDRGHMLIQGCRVPIVGAVSMDMTTLDVTKIPQVQVGDEVVYLGEQQGSMGTERIDAEQIAQCSDTIAWEVLTSISRRVPRQYV